MKIQNFKTILMCIIALVSLNLKAQNTKAEKEAKKEAKQEAKEDKKENKNDSCDFNNFVIENSTLNITNEKSALGAYISLTVDEKKSQAKQIFIILKMINCKGEEQFVKIELKYNNISSTWEGKQGILQNTDCNWTVVSYQYLILNYCDEAYYSDAIDIQNVGNSKSLTKQARRVKIHK